MSSKRQPHAFLVKSMLTCEVNNLYRRFAGFGYLQSNVRLVAISQRALKLIEICRELR